jgi:hypothetical protein
MPSVNPRLIEALRANMQTQNNPGGMRSGAFLAQQPTSSQTSLVGDRQLATEGRTITPIQGVRGGFNVAYNGNNVGQLLRGGKNGRFVGNGAPIPQPLMGQSQMPGPMRIGGQGGGMRIGGGGGMAQPPRQYAANPFQQQMMQAQMLRRPIAQAAPPPMGGVGYDPNG